MTMRKLRARLQRLHACLTVPASFLALADKVIE
jgi:hypothetical protein